MQALDHPLHFWRPRLPHLHAHDRGDQLQVILDPVMHFTQQHILLAQRVLDLRFVMQDRIGHADKGVADIAQFSRSAVKIFDRDNFAVLAKVMHRLANIDHMARDQQRRGKAGHGQAGQPHQRGKERRILQVEFAADLVILDPCTQRIKLTIDQRHLCIDPRCAIATDCAKTAGHVQ